MSLFNAQVLTNKRVRKDIEKLQNPAIIEGLRYITCVERADEVVVFVDFRGAIMSIHYPNSERYKYPFYPFSIQLEAGRLLSEVLPFGNSFLQQTHQNVPKEDEKYRWQLSYFLCSDDTTKSLLHKINTDPAEEASRFFTWKDQSEDLYCKHRLHRSLFMPSDYPDALRQGLPTLIDVALEPSFVQLVARVKAFLSRQDEKDRANATSSTSSGGGDDATSGQAEALASFLQVLKSENLIKEDAPEVYSFPMFTRDFCRMLLEEKENYFLKAKEVEGLVIARPNSMNNYGLIVDHIGLKTSIADMRQQYLLPVSKFFFPKEAAAFDYHHAFIVSYEGSRDTHLDMHHDSSTVTWNVCLGNEGFVGSGLTFCGNYGSAEHRKQSHQYKHEIGRAVVHLGRRRHGADIITEGERHNLIIWNTNQAFEDDFSKKKRDPGFYKAEAGPPDVQCLSYTHDRDFAMFKEYPDGTVDNAAQGQTWCPPQGFEYEGFPESRILMAKIGDEVEAQRRRDRERNGNDEERNSSEREQKD